MTRSIPGAALNLRSSGRSFPASRPDTPREPTGQGGLSHAVDAYRSLAGGTMGGMAAASAAPTKYVRQKAQRLLRDGRVTDHGREDFTVAGDHGTYSVLLPARRLDRGGLCSCPAWRACSHIHACKLLVAEGVGACP